MAPCLAKGLCTACTHACHKPLCVLFLSLGLGGSGAGARYCNRQACPISGEPACFGIMLQACVNRGQSACGFLVAASFGGAFTQVVWPGVCHCAATPTGSRPVLIGRQACMLSCGHPPRCCAGSDVAWGLGSSLQARPRRRWGWGGDNASAGVHEAAHVHYCHQNAAAKVLDMPANLGTRGAAHYVCLGVFAGCATPECMFIGHYCAMACPGVWGLASLSCC